MSETSKEQARVEVEIQGHVFRLRAPVQEHDRLKRAARHVENVLRDLEKSNTATDSARLGIQAAFLIALDFYKYMEDQEALAGVTEKSSKKFDDLLRQLDESLKSF